MRSYIPVLLALTFTPVTYAQDLAKARLLEKDGDALGARAVLRAGAGSGPEAQLAYAEFLHRHRDPDARSAYERVLNGIDGQRKNEISRRLVLLNLLAGDRAGALKFYEVYKVREAAILLRQCCRPGRRTPRLRR